MRGVLEVGKGRGEAYRGWGREGERKAYSDRENPENVFDAEAGATCLIEYDSDCAVDAVTA